MAETLINLGVKLMPFSFFFYLPFRTFLYIINRNHIAKLIKGIWYLSLGLGYVSNMYDVNFVVMFICFMEAWDLTHEFIAGRKSKEA
ncbi:hypothetical protein [Pontibacillus salipaludis]|uniref:hypothetical protein n=1 Tax=Pontibacillus salipaludis TaxID=1697394 RepID=UPI0031EC6CC7